MELACDAFNARAWELVGQPILTFVGHDENVDDCFVNYNAQLQRIAVRGPFYLSIAPPRSMTTWLFSVLKRHSALDQNRNTFVPAIKETNFFWNGWLHGSAEFDRCQEMAATGRRAYDISPSYASLPPRAIGILRANFPDLKILLMLRDPVARTLSHFIFEKTRPGGGGLSKEDLNDLGAAGWAASLVSFAGLYSPVRILDRWLEHFPAEQISLVFCDELAANKGQSPAILGRFLGFESFKARLSEIVNDLNYSGIEIPEVARAFLEAFFASESVQLRDRVARYFHRDLPAAWRVGVLPGIIPICRTAQHKLEYEEGAFRVIDAEGHVVLNTVEPVSALGTAMTGSLVEMPAARVLDIHFALANNRSR